MSDNAELLSETPTIIAKEFLIFTNSEWKKTKQQSYFDDRLIE